MNNMNITFNNTKSMTVHVNGIDTHVEGVDLADAVLAFRDFQEQRGNDTDDLDVVHVFHKFSIKVNGVSRAVEELICYVYDEDCGCYEISYDDYNASGFYDVEGVVFFAE